MPIHDWARVKSGKFHHFHQDWIIEIGRALNGGLLPPGRYIKILLEQTYSRSWSLGPKSIRDLFEKN